MNEKTTNNKQTNKKTQWNKYTAAQASEYWTWTFALALAVLVRGPSSNADVAGKESCSTVSSLTRALTCVRHQTESACYWMLTWGTAALPPLQCPLRFRTCEASCKQIWWSRSQRATPTVKHTLMWLNFYGVCHCLDSNPGENTQLIHTHKRSAWLVQMEDLTDNKL